MLYSGHRFQYKSSISSLVSSLPCLGAGTLARSPAVPAAGGSQLITPTPTTGLKPFRLFVSYIVLQPSFSWQPHSVTFPIKREPCCSLSAPLPFKPGTLVVLEKAQQVLSQAMPVLPGDGSFLRNHWLSHTHLGAQPLSASALMILFKEIHTNNTRTDPQQKEDTTGSVPG